MDKTVIEKRLRAHLEEAMHENGISDWFAIASNGSVNYALDCDGSDIDSKLLTIPNLKMLIENKRDNKTHIMRDNGEHVEIKDVAIYMKTVLKQNINFVETLFAKGVIVNSRYEDEWAMLYDNRESIARYDVERSIKCMYGMMCRKRRSMDAWTESRADSFKGFGYDVKSFHHLMRLKFFMSHYIVDNWSYEDCLTRRDDNSEVKLLMDSKRGLVDKETACELADMYLLEAKAIVDNYVGKPADEEVLYEKWSIENLIELVVYDIIENNLMHTGCLV